MKFLFFTFALFYFFPSFGSEVSIRLCADEISQYPFVFVNEKKVIGVYPNILDIVVLKSTKYQFKFVYELMPWKRCLEELKKGSSDAALTASYKKEREQFLFYPKGSDSENGPCESKFKIQCNEHVIVTLKNDKFVYNGNPKTILQPVRATRGYSVVDDLIKIGITPKELNGEENTLKQLVYDGNGSAILTGIIARALIKDKQYKDIIVIQKIPFIKKSYYVPFSKKTKITPEVMNYLWQNIAIQSNEKSLLKALKDMEKYNSYH